MCQYDTVKSDADWLHLKSVFSTTNKCRLHMEAASTAYNRLSNSRN